jgi:cation:H+ antiporter
LVFIIPIPALCIRFAGIELDPVYTALIFGAAVVGAAILLAWAAEAAQMDISGSLAIALLALIAVLPEYAVDLYFAYTAGHEPEYAQYAAGALVPMHTRSER